MATPRHTEFETVAPAALKAEVTDLTVLDPGNAPVTVLTLGQSWGVRVSWKTEDIPPAIGLAQLLAGNWQVSAYLESMGKGFEDQVGTTQTVPYQPWPAAGWTAIINVPGALPPTTPDMPMAYRLTTTICFENGGGVPTSMAGYVDGPTVQFHT